MIDLTKKKILVTGAHGFLGSFVMEKLAERGVSRNNVFTPTRREIDLTKRENCYRAVKGQEIVIHLAAKVGGSKFNIEKPGESFYENLVMGVEMMEAARVAGAEKFVNIGTFCSYPDKPPIPIKEEYFWDGYPEDVNASYGIAKKMLLVQGNAYRGEYGFNSIYLIPTNIYGPRDNFEYESAHVIPAIVRRVLEAKADGKDRIVVWGSGKSKREFIYVEDVAEAIVLAVERYDKPDPINISTGTEISIGEVVETVRRSAGYDGDIQWDTSRPDKRLQCTLDVSRAEKEFGFKAKTSLEEGIKKTVDWYTEEMQKSVQDFY